MLKHVTVILPIDYRGGSLRVAKTIARMIKRGSMEAGNPCSVRIAALEDRYDLHADFGDVREEGIEVREFAWAHISNREAETIALVQHKSVDLMSPDFQVPVDGINDLMDSDIWLFVSDRFNRPLAPVKPFVVFATDYIQRYVPEIFSKKGGRTDDLPLYQSARMADAVFTTTPHTRLDAISFAGIPAERVHLAPMDFDPTWIADAEPPIDFSRSACIIWPTNANAHKNHVRAFEALIQYYERLGGQLDVKLVGPNTKWIDPSSGLPDAIKDNDYIRGLRKQVSSSTTLHRHVNFAGELSDAAYAKALTEARFLWNPTLFDNGTFAVAEAAWCGCPSLSSNYPQMRYIGERFSIPLELFNARSVDEMAQALKSMETKAPQVRKNLPSRDALSQHSWERYASQYWAILNGALAR
ncbi:glycosyltransferase [Chelativorans sp. AA-79]|uniref:glycosyltransferase n=1 Tax=Chelativorans sp. AA-79 TaxID=3028735 RepID=UPI0023F98EE6|nr:glycosyltransferase [Chelativorans sp. AA-79]WEX10269.1 glycosyltransferase [Chelativorans sp. AA-79]